MIRIRVLRQDDGGMEITAVGHAGQAPLGKDIVCAGVSALLYGFVAYLESLPPIATEEGEGSPHLECAEGDGTLRIRTRGLGGADILGWRVTAAGIRLIESVYPACVALQGCSTLPARTHASK